MKLKNIIVVFPVQDDAAMFMAPPLKVLQRSENRFNRPSYARCPMVRRLLAGILLAAGKIWNGSERTGVRFVVYASQYCMRVKKYACKRGPQNHFL